MQILVIAAHPDDEIFGMGGTIAKHIKIFGDTVSVCCLSDGVSSRNHHKDKDIKERFEALSNSAKYLGYDIVDSISFPDNSFDSIPLLDIAKEIESVKKITNPDIVYTHSPSDLNIDHRMVCHASLIAFRPSKTQNCKEIRAFEVPSSTDYSVPQLYGREFEPNLYIDISNQWEDKLKSLKCYQSELSNDFPTRSIDGFDVLSRYRGNQSGLQRAEAFQILRKIIK